MSTWTNWSGSASGHPAHIVDARSTEDVVRAVQHARDSGTTVKMPGSGHSFTDIAVANDTMLNPRALAGITAIDAEELRITAWSGTTLGDLNRALEAVGLSLHNMGDVDKQTLAGATSTGTHGTGGVAASLAMQLSGLEIVTGTGEVIRANAATNPEVFSVARVGLGALGIITKLTFDVEPMFTLEAHEHPMRWDAFLATFDQLQHDNYYFEAYWFPNTDRLLVKENNRVDGDPEPLSTWRSWLDDHFLSNHVFEAVNRVAQRRPSLTPAISRVCAQALSPRRYSDVPHKVFTSPRNVRFNEMEYAIPRESVQDALREVRALMEKSRWNIAFPIEIRNAPADDIPLSASSGRASAYLAFHTYRGTDYRDYFASIERLLRDYDGRPHWGKLHTRTAADLAPAYPSWGEFIGLRNTLDPDRIFANDYLRRVLGD